MKFKYLVNRFSLLLISILLCFNGFSKTLSGNSKGKAIGYIIGQSEVFDGLVYNYYVSDSAPFYFFNVENGEIVANHGSWIEVKWNCGATSGRVTAYDEYYIESACLDVVIGSGLTAGTISGNQTICSGSSPTPFTQTSPYGGDGNYTYQWQSSLDGSSWTNISGATAATYSAPALTTTAYYRRNVTNGCYGTVSSNAIMVTVLQQQTSQDQNYILTHTVRRSGVTNPALVSGLSVEEVNQQVQYFDGLGRPLQIVTVKGSSNKRDLVQPMQYDAFGRQAKTYLPYVSSDCPTSAYRSNALIAGQGVWAHYKLTTQSVDTTSFPFSEQIFEPSPLNRVTEQGQPGKAFRVLKDAAGGSTLLGNTVKTEYGTNTATEVKLWAVTTNGATGTTNYGVGQLHKITLMDENWKTANGQVGKMEEFKDKLGRVVLKRIYNKNPQGVIETLSTYYAYDDFGNLRYVLPPAVTVSSFVETDTQFKDLMYGYHYDGRKRLVEKKIPGKDWEYLVYNKQDQLVLTQNGNQRAAKEWTYTKYDVFGRVVSTGKYIHVSSVTQNQMVSAVNAISSLWESRATGSDYSNAAFPASGVAQVYTVNYYDDYSFPQASTYPYQTDTLNAKSDMVRGLLTGTKVNVLGSTDFLWTVNYYDKDGRVIQQHNQNYMGGKDVINTKYNFTGQPLVIKRGHTGLSSLTVLNWFQYDHLGRKIREMEKINSEPRVILADYVYNELGQLVTKKLHSTNNGNSYIQTVKYSYNVRGWLKKINDPANISLTSSDKFGLELKYDDGTTPQYNGNISAMSWKNGNRNQLLSYSYTYDGLNRLKDALSHDGTYNETIGGYDLMGNILSLSRSNNVDNLSYIYSGNRLTSVTESLATNTLGQPSGTTTYSAYDANGNLTASTGAKAITISYNTLNLPQTMTISGGTISYTYDATGKKLKKVAGTSTTHYVNGIQYSGNTVEFVQTTEGRAVNKTSSFEYNYNLIDHLGNVRVSLDKAGTLIQESNYYPFGMQIPDKNLVGSTANKYLYNGKELQDEYNLNQYDYGARFYDPVIARWNILDPLQEDEYLSEFDKEYSEELVNEGYDVGDDDLADGRKYAGGIFNLMTPKNAINANTSAVHYNESPYVYVGNNPINFIDPVGLDSISARQLPEVTVATSSDNNNNNNNWLGPVLIMLGQPIKALKPVGACASSPGSSIASWTLAKVLPMESTALKKTQRKVVRVVSKKLAKRVGTRVVGRFLGRLVPYVGWALTAYDVYENKEDIGGALNEWKGGKDASTSWMRNPDGSKKVDYSVCFEAGTFIYSSKDLVPIEKISIGDSVYSYNFSTNQIKLNKVINTLHKETTIVYEVKFGKERIHVTAEHPFYVENLGWMKAKKLKVGYKLKTIKNIPCKISEIKCVSKKVDVYNIEVDGDHNYFVTNTRALVHNKKITILRKKLKNEKSKLSK